MKLSRRQLSNIIENYFLNTESLISEVNYENISDDEVDILINKVRKYSTKINSIYQKNLKIAKERQKRRLISNTFLEKVRDEIKKVLPDEIFLMTGYEKDIIVDLIVPSNRKELMNPKDNTFNIYPEILENFDKFCNNIKKQLGSINPDDFSGSKLNTVLGFVKRRGDVPTLFSINDTKFFNMHLGYVKHEDELVYKAVMAFGLISKGDIEKQWADFNNAIFNTIMHEMSHMFDVFLQKESRGTSQQAVAKMAMRKFRKQFPGVIKFDAKSTSDMGTPLKLNPFYKIDDERQSGSEEVKSILAPIFIEKAHTCKPKVTDDDRSKMKDNQKKLIDAIEDVLKQQKGGQYPAYKEYSDQVSVDCQYLNIQARDGQSEILTRIRGAKEIRQNSIGTAPFKEKDIYILRNTPVKDLPNDVGMLIPLIKKDASDKEVADAFNKVVPPG